MNTLEEIIRAEIAAQDGVTFARFMELALYHPAHGYYEKQPGRIGRGGDFYTSVSVGSVFGELLAYQFAEWAESQSEPRSPNGGLAETARAEPFQILEAGAHDGRLVGDILGWMRQHRPRLFSRAEYFIAESSPRRQAWQRDALGEFVAKVRWGSDVASLKPGCGRDGVRGVIFANELLDAFPVHRVGWDAAEGRWFEWGVGVASGRLAWIRLPQLSRPVREFQLAGPGAGASLNEFPASLQGALPDGFTLELCPQAVQWWTQAARRLERGRLIAFDYGLTAEERFLPQRAGGTLRSYHQHQAGSDVLACAGEQDLTAHVDWSALQRAGEAAGLKTLALLTQEQFLVGVLRAMESAGTAEAWTPERARQLQTLIHPNHFGRAFRVLIQERGGG